MKYLPQTPHIFGHVLRFEKERAQSYGSRGALKGLQACAQACLLVSMHTIESYKIKTNIRLNSEGFKII